MKKIIILITIMITIGTTATACDICGCGVGNSYLGILPEFRKTIFGLRYRYNSLFTHIGAGGATTYLTSKEKYSTIELWGGWNIGKKFRIMTALPYSFNERVNQGNTTSKNGIGDITITGYYQLVNSKKQLNNKLLVQSLWIGGGIKLPTGKYNPADKTGTNETNLFQLGTASTDFTLNAMYDIRLQDAGLNISSSYKMNTANKYEYCYGNKFSINGQAYYKFRVKNKVTIAPNAGVMYETAQKDKDNSFIADISGGNLLMGTAGVELSGKKISVGANIQTPFSQSLASGTVKTRNRAMVHVSYVL